MAPSRPATYVESPPIIRFLFTDTRMAWLWLILRIYLGYQWFEAGYHKVISPGWVVTGESLKGFWAGAVVLKDGKGPITYGWFRDFLNGLLATDSYTWFGKLIAFGEMAIGIALILGLFVYVAAFFGAFMNMNFMLAGSSSTNPELFLYAILLLVAWRIAGYWGVDRFIQPYVGRIVRGVPVIGPALATPKPSTA